MSPRSAEPLTRDRLFERALAIVDREGLNALTMRRLATDVGVKAPSLYNHVTGKAELVDGALGVMRSEMQLPDSPPGDWMAAMEGVLSEYRRVLAAHPNMMSLAGRRLEGRDGSGLEYLVRQGFTVDQAVELYQSLVALVVGFSMFGSGHVETDTHGLSDEFRGRLAEWRDETCITALRAIMEAAERNRSGVSGTSPGDPA